MTLERELSEQMRIIAHNTNTNVYSASYWPQYRYPYRLAKCNKAWGALRDASYEFMVDSAYQESDVTNLQVIENAIELNPDYIFPKDYPGQPDRTLQSFIEFEELMADRDDLNAMAVPIIQPPHADHLKSNLDFYSNYSKLAVGGLQKYDPMEQIKIILNIREVVGSSVELHGFGIGTSFPMIKAMREYPKHEFLNSIDVSTAERAIRNGQIPDKTLTQHTFQTPYGEKSTTVRAQFSKALLIMINYLLSDLVNERTLEEAYYEETGLPDVHEAVEGVDIRSRHELDFGIAEETADASQATTLSAFN